MTLSRRPSLRSGRASRGFTLIELLISMTIGLVLIGALGIIMARFEQSKNQNSTTMDLAQGTGYMAYDLDRQIRSAGSGMFTSKGASFGCPLAAARNGAQILPRLTAFPAPFAAVPVNLRAVPLIVFPGAGQGGSDLIQVTTFASGTSESPLQVQPNTVTVNSMTLFNTLGLRAGDLLMMQETALNCLIVQIDPTFAAAPATTVLPLAGPRFAAAVGLTSIVAYGRTGAANVMPIGNANGNQPQIQLIGINASQQLVAYDALQFNNVPNSDVPVPLAENVMDMRALYGVDNNEDGIVDRWVAPSAAPFDPATMNNNTTAAQGAMASIVALRLSLVVRGDRIEKESDPRVAPTSLTMFSALPGFARTVAIDDQERRRNYRLIELSIPIRNAILSAPKRIPPT
ncbi:PilW family protein [Roseateles sp. UC29_93]|uniref:PilW family protein n=1 Tax=Roseateles sp. UC29_93 TaxID=3350177 RepID=UPI003671045D